MRAQRTCLFVSALVVLILLALTTLTGLTAPLFDVLPTGWQLPVKGAQVTAWYCNNNTEYGGEACHTGIDFGTARNRNADILASRDGKVTFIQHGWAGYQQFSIFVNHGQTAEGCQISTFYSHVKNVRVIKGQTVQAGQKIATAFGTDSPKGFQWHLHFGAYIGNPANPIYQHGSLKGCKAGFINPIRLPAQLYGDQAEPLPELTPYDEGPQQALLAIGIMAIIVMVLIVFLGPKNTLAIGYELYYWLDSHLLGATRYERRRTRRSCWWLVVTLLQSVCCIVILGIFIQMGKEPAIKQKVVGYFETKAAQVAEIKGWSDLFHKLPKLPPLSTSNPPLSPTQQPPSIRDCEVSDKFPDRIRRWCNYITESANKNNLDPDLVAALIYQESGGNPNAISKDGAVGLMQIMPSDGPAAIKFPGIFSARPTTKELLDPQFNIKWGSKFLSRLIKVHGSTRDGLKAYGPAGVGYYYADIVLRLYVQYRR